MDYVDGQTIIILNDDGEYDEYLVPKFQRSNQSGCINHRPIVRKGDEVQKGDVLADGPSCDGGELALGEGLVELAGDVTGVAQAALHLLPGLAVGKRRGDVRLQVAHELVTARLRARQAPRHRLRIGLLVHRSSSMIDRTHLSNSFHTAYISARAVRPRSVTA